MEDPDERLIRQTLGRCVPPTPSPTLADDVLRRVTTGPPARDRRRATSRRWLAGSWLATAAASIEVLARVSWSDGLQALAWGLALVLVPLAYGAALWPERAVGLLVLWGRPLLGGPLDAPAAVRPGSPSARRRGPSVSPP
jgi:hypothetical protein